MAKSTMAASTQLWLCRLGEQSQGSKVFGDIHVRGDNELGCGLLGV